MNKINSKLILSGLEILVILAFGLIVLIPNETKAERPYYIPYYYFNPQPANNPITNYSNPVAYSATIVGCEGRNTGFSTVTGQSCVGNYINNPTPTTVVRNYTYNTTNTTVPATVKEIVNQEPLKDNKSTTKDWSAEFPVLKSKPSYRSLEGFIFPANFIPVINFN